MMASLVVRSITRAGHAVLVDYQEVYKPVVPTILPAVARNAAKVIFSKMNGI